jgi:hypothetical protein
MKKYKFLVTQTDTYKKVFEVEGTSMIAAKTKLEEDLETLPLDMINNTLDKTIVTVKTLKL